MDREQLSKFDGKDGRKAYVGYNGKVYDVSESRLWKEGQHVKRHFAGRDLTDDLEKAPHAEEVFSRVAVVDELTEAPHQKVILSTEDKLREIYRRLHPHPMFIHFPMGLLTFAVFMQVLFLLTGDSSFETTAFHCIAAGGLMLFPTMFSGFFSWWVNYKYAKSPVFLLKISFSCVLLIICAIELYIRFSNPAASYHEGSTSVVYNTLVFLNLPVMAVIGYNGGKITWG
jgi:predicted heme/steroid binding protein/uncharacterized membrane protein